MNIAIVGSGIAGLAAARVLARRHAVRVFEAEPRLGGHTHTVEVGADHAPVPVDTGFIVFNEPNYPNLCRLFRSLGVDSRDSDMSFSVRCEASGVEYNGTSLDRLFVQPRNLVSREHWRMLADIARFNREAPGHLRAGLDDAVSLARYVAEQGYSEAFVARYLVPLGASLWSTGAARFARFPMRFVIEFLDNHAMLGWNDRPTWKTVVGGSSSYIAPLVAPFADAIETGAPVRRVRRLARGVRVDLEDGRSDAFDEVVLACHADQALAMVDSPDGTEAALLGCFPYESNAVVLHTDTRMLPRARRAWASWNYRICAEAADRATVTYDMNRLQGLDAEETYCVSLNPGGRIDPARVLRRFEVAHPVFEPGRRGAQRRHAEMIRRERISYCGAYWGYGFHEDGLASALGVGEAFDLDLAA